MFDIGLSELLIVLVVALIALGPKKLPEIARALGRGLAEFRRTSDDLRRTIFQPEDDPAPPGYHDRLQTPPRPPVEPYLRPLTNSEKDPSSPLADPADSGKSPGTPPADPDQPRESCAPHGPGLSGEPGVAQGPDALRNAEATQAPGVSGEPEVTRETEVPRGPDAPREADVPGEPEVTRRSDGPQGPEVSWEPNAPRKAGAPSPGKKEIDS